MSNAVELIGISKILNQDKHSISILKNVSLSVITGTVTAVVGKSGSGKTTLLSIASGIDTPSNGTVKILGKNYHKMSSSEKEEFRNKNIGLLFQNYHLISELTCEENIRMPLCFSKYSPNNDLIDEWIQQFGLKEKRYLYPSQMSGGEQQRTAILRAIVNNPKIIFADEPTGALDQKTGTGIIKFLINYSHKSGKTVMLVTHDKDIAKMCDRIVEVSDGEIISIL